MAWAGVSLERSSGREKAAAARDGSPRSPESAAATVLHGQVQEVVVEDVGGRKEQLIRVEGRFAPDHRGASRGRLRSVLVYAQPTRRLAEAEQSMTLGRLDYLYTPSDDVAAD